MVVLDLGRRDDPRRDRPRPVGRDPSPGADVRRQGDAGSTSTPFGLARAHLPGQGMGLLARPFRPADVTARGGRGGVLHRREGAAPGTQLPGDRGRHLRDPVLRQHQAPAMESADHRGRVARPCLRLARGGLSGVRAAVPSQAERTTRRDAVHPGQHQRDQPCVRVEQHPVRTAERDGAADRQAARRQRGHRVEHPRVAAARPQGEPPVGAAVPSVLRLQRRRRGPLRRERCGAGAHDLRARGPPAGARSRLADVAERPSGVHARVRRRCGAGERGDDAGPTRLRAAGPATDDGGSVARPVGPAPHLFRRERR